MKNYFLSFIFLIFLNSVQAQLPIFQWAKGFYANNQSNFSVYSNGRSVAVDELGNVYSAGLFYHTVDFDPGPGEFNLTAANTSNAAIYISKLSPSGDFIWAIQIPTRVEFGNIELKIDHNNNVLIASDLRFSSDFDPGPGVFTLTPIGATDAFVAKYNTNGSFIWAKQFGGPGNTGPQSDVLDIDNENNVIVCGNFNNTVDFNPGVGVFNLTSTAHKQSFIVKLNGDGNFIWAKQFGNSAVVYNDSDIFDVKCDGQGSIYLTGHFSGTCDFDPGPNSYLMQSKGMMDVFVVKLDPNGNLIWSKSIGNATNNSNEYGYSRGLDVDEDHNVYITGEFLGTFDFDPSANTHIRSSNFFDWYILKLNSEGNFLWVGVMGSSQRDVGMDIAVGNNGNIFVIGEIGPIADLDPGPGVYSITTVSPYGAAAIVKINANGSFNAAGTFDQIGSNYGGCYLKRLAIDNLESVYITGYSEGIIDSDPGSSTFPFNGNGTQLPFVFKLARCTNVTSSILNISSCDKITFNNEDFDSTGTYIRIIPNSTGCDSVVTLNLIINKKFTEQSKTICEGENFFVGGANQTVSGVFQDTLISSLNCDSIVTTLLIVNLSPILNLGSDRDICSGTQSVLNPGSTFSEYLWQNGTTSNTFTVSAPGLYWVKVTNEYNCTATDSLLIKSILPSPNNFLKNTDSICSYQELEIAASGIFNQYEWSTGALTKQISIERPGSYWLKVTDANKCTGTDSISIFLKECRTGIYFPNSFTPNNDGLNDIFRAIPFGKLLSFRLQIFDRGGKIIFQTQDPFKGWDGSYKGINYSTQTFVWQCFYQLENRKPELLKGTVNVIR